MIAFLLRKTYPLEGFAGCCAREAKTIFNNAGSYPATYWDSDQASISTKYGHYANFPRVGYSETRLAALNEIVKSLEAGVSVMFWCLIDPRRIIKIRAKTTDHFLVANNRGIDSYGPYILFADNNVLGQ
jgi:hypothetical protein